MLGTGHESTADPPIRPAALPSAGLLQQQAQWLGPARSRLFRRVSIARRRSVLDLGAGSGAVTAELVRRTSGTVVAIDRALSAMVDPAPFSGAFRIAADALCLPAASNSFDLVFCQYALLWIRPLEAVLAEIWRVLQHGGTLLAIEPDYGGLIEYPASVAVRQIWLSALERAGADPLIGRHLPDLLARHGFAVRVDLLESIEQASNERFDYLREMPLEAWERAEVDRAASAAQGLPEWKQIAHLPMFLITAGKPD